MTIEKNVFSVNHANESNGFLLWQVTNLWQRKIKHVLEPYELTHVQFVLLTSTYWLTLQKQLITQKILSDFSKVDPMSTSTVLRTLEKKGLITRQEDCDDTRAKIVKMTQKGIDNVKPSIVAVEQFDREFFSILGIQQQSFNQSLIHLSQIKQD